MWFVKIGSSIKGPFDEEELRLMIARDELSRLHVVSVDKQNWESASALVSTLEGRPDMEAPKSKASSENWFYSDNGRKRGPYSLHELKQLIGEKTIGAQTQVFDHQSNEWVKAGTHPRLKNQFKQSRVWVKLGVAASAVAGLAAIVWVAILLIGGSGGINEDLLRETVGRVVVIEQHELENGSIIEVPMSTGTGFCVTESGYFLTNEHVVESFNDEEEIEVFQGLTSKVTKKIVVFLDQLRLDAELTYTSTRYDLAVLKVVRDRPMNYLPLSTERSPKLQTEVFAAGFPGVADLDQGQSVHLISYRNEIERAMSEKATVYADVAFPSSDLKFSLEQGNVSKVVDDDAVGGFHVLHNAQTFQGNSGGPLLDLNGLVIGINTELAPNIVEIPVALPDGSEIIDNLVMGKKDKAYLVHQFRSELEEHIPGELLMWK